MEVALEQYRAQLQEWYDGRVAWYHTGDWSILAHMQTLTRDTPTAPIPPQPPAIWHYRHPEQEGDDYNSYELLYGQDSVYGGPRKVVRVGNRIYKHGSGRYVGNSSTRSGRLNYQATVAAYRAWERERAVLWGIWDRTVRAMCEGIQRDALERAPHRRYVDGEGNTVVLVPQPGPRHDYHIYHAGPDQLVCMDDYPGDTENSVYARRVLYQKSGRTKDEINALERADSATRLRKSLRLYGVSRQTVREIVEDVESRPMVHAPYLNNPFADR